MKRAYKYRIYPTDEQKVLLAKTFGCCRVVWNWALETRRASYRETGKFISNFDLMKRMKRELKTEKEWLREVNSQSLQNSIVNLGRSFENFFRGTASYPNFKGKYEHQSFQCPQHCSVDFKHSTITIPKAKDIPAVLHRRFRGDIKTVTISKTPTGKYYASVLVENHASLPEVPQSVPSEKVIGIDAGLKTLAVVSDGREIKSDETKEEKDKRKRKLKLLQRRLSKKTKGSCSYCKTKQRIARLHERVANRRADFIAKATYRLTHESQVQAICVENLNVQGMMKNHRLAYSFADASIGEFMRQLEYKCQWQGIRFVKIGRFAPSSQLCHVCGHRYRGLRLNERKWTCPECGTHHNRDFNAAVNIKKFGLALMEALPPLRGEVKPVEQPPVDDRTRRVPKKQCCASASAGEAGKERSNPYSEAALSLAVR